MIGSQPLPLSDLAGEPLIEGDERSTYRSGLTEFSPAGSDPRRKAEHDRRYTAEDLARAVDDAQRATARETETALRQAIAGEIEQRQCDLLAAIKDQLEQRQSAFEEELTRLAEISQRLAVALAKAVVPQALERHPLIDIADSLRATLARLAAEPSIELHLPTDLVESGERLLADLASEAGFTGEIITVADPALGDGDVELRWKGGAVDRRLDRLQAEVTGLVDRWLQNSPEAEDQVAPLCAPPEPAFPAPPSDQTKDTRSGNERVTP